MLFNELSTFSRDIQKDELKAEINEGWRGPILCVFGTLFYLLASLLSKRYLITRSFFYKLMNIDKYKQPYFFRENNKFKKFYKEYFEGENNPKLLKKNSHLVKRFYLFKKLQ